MKDGYVFNEMNRICLLIGFGCFCAEDFERCPDDGQSFYFDLWVVSTAGYLHSHNPTADVFGQRLQNRRLCIGKPLAPDREGQIHISGFEVHRA